MKNLIAKINQSLGGIWITENHCKECDLTRGSFNSEYAKLPIFPYFASVYNTLISIVCGVSIGYLFTTATWAMVIQHFQDNFWLGVSSTVEILIIFIVITSVWHHYIINTQFVSWKIDKIDSIIPFLFAGLISFGIYTTINDNKPYFFTIFIPLFYLSSSIAYINSYVKLNYRKENIFVTTCKDRSSIIFSRCLSKSIKLNHLILVKYCLLSFVVFYTLSYLLNETSLIYNLFVQDVYLFIILLSLYITSNLCFDSKFCKLFGDE